MDILEGLSWFISFLSCCNRVLQQKQLNGKGVYFSLQFKVPFMEGKPRQQELKAADRHTSAVRKQRVMSAWCGATHWGQDVPLRHNHHNSPPSGMPRGSPPKRVHTLRRQQLALTVTGQSLCWPSLVRVDSPGAFAVCCEKVKALCHHGGNIDMGVSGRAKMEAIGSKARHIDSPTLRPCH